VSRVALVNTTIRFARDRKIRWEAAQLACTISPAMNHLYGDLSHRMSGTTPKMDGGLTPKGQPFHSEICSQEPVHLGSFFCLITDSEISVAPVRQLA